MLEKLRKPTIIIGFLGAVKLATDAFGYSFLTNEDVNAIANGISAIVAIIATLLNRDTPQAQ